MQPRNGGPDIAGEFGFDQFEVCYTDPDGNAQVAVAIKPGKEGLPALWYGITEVSDRRLTADEAQALAESYLLPQKRQ